MRLPIAARHLVADQRVARGRIGNAQQRLGQAHQRHPFLRRQRELLQQPLHDAGAPTLAPARAQRAGQPVRQRVRGGGLLGRQARGAQQRGQRFGFRHARGGGDGGAQRRLRRDLGVQGGEGVGGGHGGIQGVWERPWPRWQPVIARGADRGRGRSHRGEHAAIVRCSPPNKSPTWAPLAAKYSAMPTTHPDLDRIDLRILGALQRDGRISNLKLADTVSLSPTAVLARVQRLTREGFIRGYHAELDPGKLGRGMVVFVEVLLDRTTPNVFDQFKAAVQVHDEIMECHMVAGGFDYLLKTRMADMAAYRAFAGQVLWQLPGVRETRTYAVMEEVKSGTALPLG